MLMLKNYVVLSFLFLFQFSSVSAQNALSFDGSNDQVDCGNNTSVQITGTALTLEAWIYPTSWKTQIWQGNIINRESLNGGGYMLRCGNGGRLNFNIGSGPGPWNEITSGPILALNTWQHVAGTYDGSYMRIYLNGVIVDSIPKTISIFNSSSNLGIGFAPIYAGSRNFAGRIDEVRIWNSVRSESEIATNMNNELCVIPSSVKAYYRFNHGIASGTNTSVTALTDLSGNGNVGTLSNFAYTGSSSNWVAGRPLTPGSVLNSLSVSACGSYTMPNGTVVTTAGTYYDTLPSSSPCDSLIAYNITFPPAIIQNTVNDTSCLNYRTAMGKLITSSGTYFDTISSSGSCDTTIRYDIVISSAVDDSVYRVGGRITSWDTWADHQWVRCDSGFAPILGETNRFIIAAQPGDYAVIVKRGACVDTSDCVSISLTGIQENHLNRISVFPNPANDYVELKTDKTIKSVNILDLKGNLILSKNVNNNRIEISNLSKGIYILEVKSNNEVSRVRIIKQ